MDKLLSIVVPVYNTGKYVVRCLDSVLCLPEYNKEKVEVVVVNDCSPDDADAVLSRYCQDHPEVKYLKHEINKGVAAARNTGLEAGSGLYYTYVDSDDAVKSGYLREILSAIELHRPDMISYQYESCTESGDVIDETMCRACGGLLNENEGVETRRIIFKYFALSLRFNGVYRRETVGETRYSGEYTPAEDVQFAFSVFLKSKKFFIITNVLYLYYQYGMSLSHNITTKRFLGILSWQRYAIANLKTMQWFDDISNMAFCHFYGNYIGWEYDVCKRLNNNELSSVYFSDFKALLEHSDSILYHIISFFIIDGRLMIFFLRLLRNVRNWFAKVILTIRKHVQ